MLGNYSDTFETAKCFQEKIDIKKMRRLEQFNIDKQQPLLAKVNYFNMLQ